jgi:hypothetical protein
MIVYWNKPKKTKKNINITTELNENINNQTSQITNNFLLENKEILYDSLIEPKNDSFISQDSNSLLNIFQNETNESSILDNEISDNNKSEKKNNSFELIKKNFENLSLKEKELFIKNEFKKKIIEVNISDNSTATFLILMKLCYKSKYLLSILYNCVIDNLFKILLSKYNYIFIKEIYEFFNYIEIKNFINEILKYFNCLINDKNGYQIIIFFIMKKNYDVINFVFFNFLSFFVQFTLNKYSSEIICCLYSLKNDYINHQFNIKLIQNFKFIVSNKYGFDVFSCAKKYANNEDNLFFEQVMKLYF